MVLNTKDLVNMSNIMKQKKAKIDEKLPTIAEESQLDFFENLKEGFEKWDDDLVPVDVATPIESRLSVKKKS